MKHQKSNFNIGCLVLHSDGHGSCVWCMQCRSWIRPQNMNNECPGCDVTNPIGSEVENADESN